MQHVFISYTKKNEAIAKRLGEALEDSGLRCWIAPRDIAPGSAWAASIVRAIGESRLMISLVSRDAYRSEQMAHELERADTGGVPILPIRLDAAPLQGQFEYFLGNKQWLELHNGSFDDLESVVKAVRAFGPRPQEPAEITERLQPQPAHGPFGTDASNGLRRRGTGIQWIVDEVRLVVRTFVSVSMRKEKALAEFDLTDSRTLLFAFRFLVYISLVLVLLHFPTWSAQRIRYGHPLFVLSFVAEELIEAIALCFLLYAAIRSFGGKADPMQFFCAFSLLSTFRLLSGICLEPARARVISIQSQSIDEMVARLVAMENQLPIGELLVLAVAGMAVTALLIVFFAALLRAFDITARLGTVRAVMSILAGVAMWAVGVFVFSQPFEARLYEAFGSR